MPLPRSPRCYISNINGVNVDPDTLDITLSVSVTYVDPALTQNVMGALIIVPILITDNAAQVQSKIANEAQRQGADFGFEGITNPDIVNLSLASG